MRNRRLRPRVSAQHLRDVVEAEVRGAVGGVPELAPAEVRAQDRDLHDAYTRREDLSWGPRWLDNEYRESRYLSC